MLHFQTCEVTFISLQMSFRIFFVIVNQIQSQHLFDFCKSQLTWANFSNTFCNWSSGIQIQLSIISNKIFFSLWDAFTITFLFSGVNFIAFEIKFIKTCFKRSLS